LTFIALDEVRLWRAVQTEPSQAPKATWVLAGFVIEDLKGGDDCRPYRLRHRLLQSTRVSEAAGDIVNGSGRQVEKIAWPPSTVSNDRLISLPVLSCEIERQIDRLSAQVEHAKAGRSGRGDAYQCRS